MYIRADGHRLRAKTIEPPSRPVPAGRPTLVFLHEGLGCIEQWRDFPRLLVEATGLPALVYDRYGHGGSDLLQEPRNSTYQQHEAEASLPEVLEAFGVTRPILIGHSDGGTIALLYAARFPRHPMGIITEAAHVFVEEITLAGIRNAVGAFQNGGLRERLGRFHGERTDSMFYGWSETWLAPGYMHWNIEDCLGQITCPVLAIQGDDDPYGTSAQVHAIVGQVAGRSEFLMVPGCGHVPHHQAHDPVLAEMTRFIDGLKREAAVCTGDLIT
jgi:pimeloyl-ACP methyl ester carboxylesterase